MPRTIYTKFLLSIAYPQMFLIQMEPFLCQKMSRCLQFDRILPQLSVCIDIRLALVSLDETPVLRSKFDPGIYDNIKRRLSMIAIRQLFTRDQMTQLSNIIRPSTISKRFFVIVSWLRVFKDINSFKLFYPACNLVRQTRFSFYRNNQ